MFDEDRFSDDEARFSPVCAAPLLSGTTPKWDNERLTGIPTLNPRFVSSAHLRRSNDTNSPSQSRAVPWALRALADRLVWLCAGVGEDLEDDPMMNEMFRAESANDMRRLTVSEHSLPSQSAPPSPVAVTFEWAEAAEAVRTPLPHLYRCRSRPRLHGAPTSAVNC